MGLFKNLFKVKPSVEFTILLVDDEKIDEERAKAEEGLLRIQKLQEEELLRKKEISKTVRTADELAAIIDQRTRTNGYLDGLTAAYERRGR